MLPPSSELVACNAMAFICIKGDKEFDDMTPPDIANVLQSFVKGTQAQRKYSELELQALHWVVWKGWEPVLTSEQIEITEPYLLKQGILAEWNEEIQREFANYKLTLEVTNLTDQD